MENIAFVLYPTAVTDWQGIYFQNGDMFWNEGWVNECQSENIFRYPSEQECQGTEECSAVWFATPWSECTAECGGGTHSRKVIVNK